MGAYEESFNASSSTCGGNCPGGYTLSMWLFSNYVDIASWCSKYSWNQKNCQCIMNAESRNANADNENSDGSFDVGLWQINDYKGKLLRGKAPCDPNTNLNCAKKVYQWGGNMKLWSTCANAVVAVLPKIFCGVNLEQQ